MNPVDEKPLSPVFLVGFMGAGKTTVGRALARLLNLSFVDLDELIEQRSGKTVPDIFSLFGEPHFRELERQTIRSCAHLSDTIIALGGGAYVDETNRAVLRSIGTTVWLDCSLDTCISRIALDGSRPLAADEENMRALFQKRRTAYAEADLRIPVGEQNPEQLAAEIARVLQG